MEPSCVSYYYPDHLPDLGRLSPIVLYQGRVQRVSVCVTIVVWHIMQVHLLVKMK